MPTAPVAAVALPDGMIIRARLKSAQADLDNTTFGPANGIG
jgi:hypothetical protein